jgi:hypothetical protein
VRGKPDGSASEGGESKRVDAASSATESTTTSKTTKQSCTGAGGAAMFQREGGERRDKVEVVSWRQNWNHIYIPGSVSVRCYGIANNL